MVKQPKETLDCVDELSARCTLLGEGSEHQCLIGSRVNQNRLGRSVGRPAPIPSGPVGPKLVEASGLAFDPTASPFPVGGASRRPRIDPSATGELEVNPMR